MEHANAGAAAHTRRSALLLMAARIAWGVATTLGIACFITSLPPSFTLVQRPCDGAQNINCGIAQLSAADWSALHAHGVAPSTYATYALTVALVSSLTFFVVGFLIAWRKWADLPSLFVSAVFINFASISQADALVENIQGSMPMEGVHSALTFLSFPAISVFILTFPNGRFAPRWTALLPLMWGALSLLVILGAPVGVDVAVALTIWASCILAQVYRYIARATPRERLQTHWVVFGLAIGVSLLVLANLPPLIWPTLNAPGSPYKLAGIVWLSAFWMTIPIGVGIAILRSRLYDIDLLIKRTVTYGLLTALLASIYASAVFGGQHALLALTGANTQPSPILIALATLLVAALFQPARRWIQRMLDRRFYRRAYDARQTLDQFNASLRAEVDLPTMRERLLTVVMETVQPEHMSLWLREPQGRVKVARQEQAGEYMRA